MGGASALAFHIECSVADVVEVHGQRSEVVEQVLDVGTGRQERGPPGENGGELVAFGEHVVEQVIQFHLIDVAGGSVGHRQPAGQHLAPTQAAVAVGQVVKDVGQSEAGDGDPPRVLRARQDSLGEQRSQQEGDETRGDARQDDELLPDGRADVEPHDQAQGHQCGEHGEGAAETDAAFDGGGHGETIGPAGARNRHLPVCGMLVGVADWSWLEVPVEDAARRLLGAELHRQVGDRLLRARIVEVEAYDQDDPASHTHRGPTRRNAAMFLPAGHAYVYLSHGIHHCLNIVTGVEGVGSGVLVRAVEPLEGEDLMLAMRGRDGVQLTNGPGKLGQALAITLDLTGHDLARPPLQLLRTVEVPPDAVITTTRIGISRAVEEPRRYYLASNPYVSRR